MPHVKPKRETDIRSAIHALLALCMAHPKNLTVKESTLGLLKTLTIQCHAADMPRLMGSGGSTKAHVEQVCAMLGARQGISARPVFLEPEVGTRSPLPPFAGKDRWPKEATQAAIKAVIDGILLHEARVEAYDGEDFETSIQATVSPREDAALLKKIENHLGPLAKNIGLLHGRRASLAMIQTASQY